MLEVDRFHLNTAQKLELWILNRTSWQEQVHSCSSSKERLDRLQSGSMSITREQTSTLVSLHRRLHFPESYDVSQVIAWSVSSLVLHTPLWHAGQQQRCEQASCCLVRLTKQKHSSRSRLTQSKYSFSSFWHSSEAGNMEANHRHDFSSSSSLYNPAYTFWLPLLVFPHFLPLLATTRSLSSI